MRSLHRTAFVFLALSLSAGAAIYDDFNDGNDTNFNGSGPGWTRFSPLVAFGSAATFTFPSGGYHMTSAASLAPGSVGAARVGSFRNDETYTTFFQSVDIVDWNPALGDMVMGMVARASSVGLGTTNGYISIVETDGNFSIYPIAGEAPGTVIATTNVGVLNTAKDYRMLFMGTGSALSAELYNVTDNVFVAGISGTNATYASGVGGIFAFDSSAAANQAVDATFDRYVSAVPEPASAGMVLVGAIGLLGRRARKPTLA